MAESKDSAIKLFGKTIPLSTLNQEIVSADGPPSALADSVQSATVSGTAVVGGYGDHSLEGSMHEESSRGSLQNGQDGDQDKETAGKELMEDEQEDDISHQRIEDLKEPETSSGISENPKTLSGDREISSPKSSNNGEQSETSSSQEKTLKKPDKILPCPRCNSMDTKFCYYNNYNVNQPRHFCKNCQRYWTAGGTMRNVPVGAGRRKNKSSSASHYRHIMVSEALRASQVNSTNGIHNTSLGNNGTVLRFGSDSPLCESVASVLKLSERTQNSARNGFHAPEQRILLSSGAADIRDERTSGSHFTTSNLSEKGGNAGLPDTAFKNYQGLPPPVPCFPGPPWPYLWNSAMPPPTFCPSGFPVSFYPAPTYWSCTVPAPWNVPYFSSLSSSPNQSTQSPSPTSPTLGKHSREGNILSPSTTEKEETSEDINTSERSVLVPKILRIDDPSEAAKSSIWATLGIKTEKTNSINEGSLFNGFQSRADDRNYMAETSAVLQANPAALSRSLKFHESA